MKRFDLETFNTTRNIPYCVSLPRSCEISCKKIGDLSDNDYQKLTTDTTVFKGINYVNDVLDWNITLKRKLKKNLN